MPGGEVKALGDEYMDQLVFCLIRASASLAGFIAIHLSILGVFHALHRDVPKALTFPRFDLQLAMALNPPIAFLAAQLLSVAGLRARATGLLVLVFLGLPLGVWFVWRLTLTNLIMRPLIYYSETRQSSKDEPLIDSRHQERSDHAGANLKSTILESDGIPRSTDSFAREEGDQIQAEPSQKEACSVQVPELGPFAGKALSVPCSPKTSSDDLAIRPVTARGTCPTRVDKETGEITLTCPSTRLVPVQHGKGGMRLNPHRSSENRVSALPLLTPPHQQKWVEFDMEPPLLPGSESSEIFHARPRTTFPHDAHYRETFDVDRSSFASVERAWDASPPPPPPPLPSDSRSPGPNSLPPLPASASVKYTGFLDQGDPVLPLRAGPIAEGYYESTTDNEACRLLLLRPLMRARTTTDGGRSSASLSALDFRDELPRWDKVRPRSVPILGDRNRVPGDPVYGCSLSESDGRFEWRLMERRSKFIAGYGFAFEDVLGSNHAKGRFRARPPLLWTHAILFTSRVAAAAVFGFWGSHEKSWIQICLLIFIQGFTTIHLLVCFPYASRPLQIVEGMVAMAELLIVVGAAALLLELQVHLVNSIMIGAFYFVACTLLAFELHRIDLPLKMLWRACGRLRKKDVKDS